MESFLTIAYTNAAGNAVELPLNQGQQQPQLTLNRNVTSYFSWVNPGADPAVDTDIPFEGQVCVYKDRVGNPGAYNGGTRIFVGRRGNFRGYGAPKTRNTQVTLANAFYDLAETVFQHYWLNLANGAPAPAPVFFSRINLFQNIQAGPDAPWGYMTTDQQIIQILQYQIAAGTLLQVGRIDPVWNMPLFPCRAVKCLEALQICIKSIPDAAMWLDYTTNDNQGRPAPTFHVWQRGNCVPATLPYAYTDPAGRQHAILDITERRDLLPSVVQFQYEQTNTVGNVTWKNIYFDTFPVNAPTTQLRAVIVPIDLRGALTTYIQGSITSIPFGPNGFNYWESKKPDLAGDNIQDLEVVNEAINDGSPNCITVLDRQGNPINLGTYPYEAVDGIAAPWMKDANGNPIKIIEAVVTAYLNYDTYQPSQPPRTQLISSVTAHPVSTQIKLTNSPPNPANIVGQPALPTTYKTVAKNEQPETVSANFAQNVYNSMLPLQYEFNYTILEQAVTQIINCGNVINLFGPGCRPAWTNMNAVVESVTVDFYGGKQVIKCGPFRHLTAQEFFEVHMMWRIRFIYENPNIRNTGQDTSQTPVNIGQNSTKQDTNAGSSPPATYQSTLGAPDANGNQFAVIHDAPNQKVSIVTLDKTGAVSQTVPQFIIDMTILAGVTEGPDNAKKPVTIGIVREKFLDPNNNCQDAHAWFLKSPTYPGA